MSVLVTLSVALQLAQTAPPEAKDLVLDFRGGRFRESVLDYFGRDARKFIKKEAEGLRITIPEGDKPVPPVGFSLKLAVEGDFEITLSYEILQAEKPEKGTGPGVSLAISANSPAKDSVSIAHRLDAANGEVIATNQTFKTPEGQENHNPKILQAPGLAGRLRLLRDGPTVVFSAAEPGADGFRELRREEFVSAPLKTIRVTADPGKSVGELDLRIHSFQIRALELSSSLPVPSAGGGLLWLIVFLVGLCLLVVAMFLAKRFLPGHRLAGRASDKG